MPRQSILLKPRLGVRKKLAKIMGIELVDANGYLISKEGNIGPEWVFLRDFINSHINDDQGLVTLALSIYGLIIFPPSNWARGNDSDRFL